MDATDVLRRIGDDLALEVAVYVRGGEGAWPPGQRHVLYARAEGAARALTLAGVVTEDEARAFLIQWSQELGLHK